jgi:Flp pilus assembly protein TadB
MALLRADPDSGAGAVTLLLAFAAALVAMPAARWREVRRRLAQVRGPDAVTPGATPSGVVPQVGGTSGSRFAVEPGSSSADVAGGGRRSRILAATAVGIGVAGLIGTGWGVPLGVAAGVGAERMLRRREPARLRRDRLAAARDLPLGADLLAAALRAGAPVDAAVGAVAEALGGPLGERLERTARSLRLGAEPVEAWGHVAGIHGAQRLVTAAIRSSASGGALAGALGRLADDLRADRAVAVEAAAQRAGVLIVLPLGLCFLPAFLLAGLVPVLIAVLGDVL